MLVNAGKATVHEQMLLARKHKKAARPLNAQDLFAAFHFPLGPKERPITQNR
jgi:hypothetical protein